MSKDPAFLFYSSDFLTGISDLTMEERGQYITLLCLQHQKGALSPKTIKISVGDVSSDVMSKFEQDEAGNFLNKRLQNVIELREKYVPYKIASATLGGLLNTSRNLKASEKKKIKQSFNIEDFTNLKTKEEIKHSVKEWFKHQLSICLTIYENENEIENETINEDGKKENFSFKNELLKLVVNPKIVDEWLKVRKSKKAVNSETAFAGFLREANKTDLTIDEILTTCVERSWGGFNSEWIKQNTNGKQNSQQLATATLKHIRGITD